MLLLLAMLCLAGCASLRGRIRDNDDAEIGARRLSRDGVAAMDEGDWDDAERLFAAALEIWDGDDRAHWGMAEVLWHRETREQAVEHMQRAVRLSGEDPSLHSRLGRMHFEMGQLAEAREIAAKILAADRENAEAWELTGDIQRLRGRKGDALKSYHQALALRPVFLDVQLKVARLYQEQQRFDRVLATLDRVQDRSTVAGCPSDVHHLRGIAMHRLGRPDEACRCFVLAFQTGGADPDLLCDWAAAELDDGDVVAARMTVGRALQIDPDYSRALEFATVLDQSAIGRVAADSERPPPSGVARQ